MKIYFLHAIHLLEGKENKTSSPQNVLFLPRLLAKLAWHPKKARDYEINILPWPLIQLAKQGEESEDTVHCTLVLPEPPNSWTCKTP